MLLRSSTSPSVVAMTRGFWDAARICHINHQQDGGTGEQAGETRDEVVVFHGSDLEVFGAGGLQRSIRSAKSRRKSSRHWFTLLAPG